MEVKSTEEKLDAKIKEWEEASKNKDRTQNDTRNIYSKHEISKLRREFISSCIKIIDADLMILKSDLYKKCEKIKYFN